ncbi:TPA: hypothetical protein SLN67_003527 [Serratia marcescens]|nr:hypothetical protein [Serratia marcescens]
MTTPITIDTTLISAIISAAVAIIVACVTLVWTNRSNRKLEASKLNNEKKEELFSNHQTLMAIIAEINTYNMRSSADILSIALSLEPKKDEAIRKIKLLTNMYFHGLDKYYDDLIPQMHILFWHIRTKGNPGIEEFNSLFERLNSISEKILSLKW